ncbi:unnamed protein product, partial [Symbiodinium sp. CCMP2456]
MLRNGTGDNTVPSVQPGADVTSPGPVQAAGGSLDGPTTSSVDPQGVYDSGSGAVDVDLGGSAVAGATRQATPPRRQDPAATASAVETEQTQQQTVQLNAAMTGEAVRRQEAETARGRTHVVLCLYVWKGSGGAESFGCERHLSYGRWSVFFEAIQAEVQRQMSGLLAKLQESESRNAELELQLEEETKAAVTFQEIYGVIQLETMEVITEGLHHWLRYQNYEAESSLQFQDWLEIASTSMSDVSEQSGKWWRAMMSLVEAAYARWLAATPIERLAIQPEGTAALCEGQWLRLNARASSMLLNVMTDELQADMLSQRASQDTGKIIFRLYTWYQPGGSAERQEVLRRLQMPSDFLKGESVSEVLKVLRSWPRWLNRCYSMGMTAPDPTVMARGLMSLTTKTIALSPDAAFRTAMLRTSLRLDGQPSLEQVGAYQRHLQAELEGLAAGLTTAAVVPRVQAVEVAAPKPEKEGNKTSAEVCRYFLKPSGCKRGEKCKYAHSMQIYADFGIFAGAAAQVPAARARSSFFQHSGNSGLDHGIIGFYSVYAARCAVDLGGDSSPEKTKPELRMMIIKDIRVGAANTAAALLDSGATQCLRSARDNDEWSPAAEVMVQLAGTSKLMMRINDAGSLLMPPSNPSETVTASGQTIVPLGELVSTLGYSLEWTPTHCLLKDPDGMVTRLKVRGGCPQLCELEALSMISRIEDRRRESLENITQETEDLLTTAALQMDKSWKEHLQDYVATGDMGAGLRGLREAPYLQGLPGDCLSGLLEPNLKEEGWKALKGVDFLSRPQRRRLWTAKRWMVHLFAGNPGHYQMFQVDEGDTVLIELDVDRCRGQDIMRSPTWRFLLWGAMMGKLDGVVGGPPGRGGVLQHGEVPKGADVKVMSVLARMMWLYSIAEAARAVKTAGPNYQRPVAFALEHPAATPVISSTASLTTNSPPRAARSLWTTTMWEAFQEAYQMKQVTFDQKCMGSPSSIPTTIGTNVYYLMGLDGMHAEDSEQATRAMGSGVWAPGTAETPGILPCAVE